MNQRDILEERQNNTKIKTNRYTIKRKTKSKNKQNIFKVIKTKQTMKEPKQM